jgi:hypothetical protein
MPAFANRSPVVCEIIESCFSIVEVLARLQNLDKSKSTGLDGLHPRVLSECANAFATPLSLIYKRSFATGSVPDLWKKSNVTPIFKKGSKLKASNYRPVSLTSVPCKVMEHIVHNRIIRHCIENALIAKAQHGFVPRKGCVTNLLESRDIITEAIHQGHAVDVIYTDFAKAFDKVPHKRLVHKISAYGIQGKVLAWIATWLADRQQRVAIDGRTSEWKDVTSGVPQGSVLGPLLFVLFINDLPDSIANHIKLYADDSKIIGIIKSAADTENLQHDIDKAVEWTNNWLMYFNVDKCKVMHVGRANNKSSQVYSMSCADYTRRPLEVSTVERDLGVMVSSDLKVRAQVEAAASTANRMLGQLKKSFRSRSFLLWRNLILTYVRPRLEFAVSAWSPHLKSDIAILEQVMRRATKVISSIKHLPYEDRLQRLRLTTLEDRRLRGDLIEQFKISHQIEEVDFFIPQVQPASHGTYSLRGHSRRLERQFVRGCEERHNFFTNRVVAPWNALSQSAVDALSLNAFKDRIAL